MQMHTNITKITSFEAAELVASPAKATPPPGSCGAGNAPKRSILPHPQPYTRTQLHDLPSKSRNIVSRSLNNRFRRQLSRKHPARRLQAEPYDVQERRM